MLDCLRRRHTCEHPGDTNCRGCRCASDDPRVKEAALMSAAALSWNLKAIAGQIEHGQGTSRLDGAILREAALRGVS